MESVNNNIISSDADALFGKNDNGLGDTLESTLRYIALKHHQGDVETIQPIKSFKFRFNSGDSVSSYIDYAKGKGIELFVLTASYGAQLLTIDEGGWVSLDTPPYPVAPFLSKVSETRVYINAELKKTIIVVKNATNKWVDMLCSSLFRILPWRFERELDEDEKNLFKAINAEDAGIFNAIINKECAKFNLRELSLRKALIGWGNGCREANLSSLRGQYRSIQRDIENYENQIASYLGKLSGLQCNISALEAQGDEHDDALYKFFLAHRQLEMCETWKGSNGKNMKYCITDTLEYFDQDEFKRVYNNPRSSIGEASDDVRDILFNIFGANRGVFRVEAMFQLENLSSITALDHRRADKYYKTHLPHPTSIIMPVLAEMVLIYASICWMETGIWQSNKPLPRSRTSTLAILPLSQNL